MENQTETQMETTVTTSDPSYNTTSDSIVYDVWLEEPGGFITGTITVDKDVILYEQLEQIETYQLQQVELLKTEIEIQQNLYTVTSYLLAAVIGFALIKLFTGFFNSVITF